MIKELLEEAKSYGHWFSFSNSIENKIKDVIATKKCIVLSPMCYYTDAAIKYLKSLGATKIAVVDRDSNKWGGGSKTRI